MGSLDWQTKGEGIGKLGKWDTFVCHYSLYGQRQQRAPYCLRNIRHDQRSFAATTLVIHQSEHLRTWTEGFANVPSIDVLPGRSYSSTILVSNRLASHPLFHLRSPNQTHKHKPIHELSIPHGSSCRIQRLRA